jgi:hypothetical protein
VWLFPLVEPVSASSGVFDSSYRVRLMSRKTQTGKGIRLSGAVRKLIFFTSDPVLNTVSRDFVISPLNEWSLCGPERV